MGKRHLINVSTVFSEYKWHFFCIVWLGLRLMYCRCVHQFLLCRRRSAAQSYAGLSGVVPKR